MANTMKAGETLLVKVTGVQLNKKVGIRKGNMLYDRHDVSFIDKQENKYIGEYLKTIPYDNDFPEGIWQYIRCQSSSEFGFEIVPTDADDKQYLPNPNTGKQQQDQLKYEPRQKVGNMSGTSIAFAFAFAKDLVIEKMKHELMLNLSEEELADKVADIADKINERMLKAAQQ